MSYDHDYPFWYNNLHNFLFPQHQKNSKLGFVVHCIYIYKEIKLIGIETDV